MHLILRMTTLLLAFVLLTGFDNPVSIEVSRLVREQDHIVIEPSSNAYKPGAFVARRLYDPNEAVVSTARLTFVCTPAYSTDKVDAQAIRVSIPSNFFGTLSLDKETVSHGLQMPYTARYSESVLVRILDQAMVQYSDVQLDEIRDKLGPKCTSNIKAQLATQNVYQITSVYEARVQYEVRYIPRLIEGAKNLVRNELRRLGTPTVDLDAEVLRGEVSVYGIAWRKIGG